MSDFRIKGEVYIDKKDFEKIKRFLENVIGSIENQLSNTFDTLNKLGESFGVFSSLENLDTSGIVSFQEKLRETDAELSNFNDASQEVKSGIKGLDDLIFGVGGSVAGLLLQLFKINPVVAVITTAIGGIYSALKVGTANASNWGEAISEPFLRGQKKATEFSNTLTQIWANVNRDLQSISLSKLEKDLETVDGQINELKTKLRDTVERLQNMRKYSSARIDYSPDSKWGTTYKRAKDFAESLANEIKKREEVAKKLREEIRYRNEVAEAVERSNEFVIEAVRVVEEVSRSYKDLSPNLKGVQEWLLKMNREVEDATENWANLMVTTEDFELPDFLDDIPLFVNISRDAKNVVKDLDVMKKMAGDLGISMDDLADDNEEAWKKIRDAIAQKSMAILGIVLPLPQQIQDALKKSAQNAEKEIKSAFDGVGDAAGAAFMESFKQTMRSIGDLATALSVSFGEAFAAGLKKTLMNELSEEFWETTLGKFVEIKRPSSAIYSFSELEKNALLLSRQYNAA